MGIDGPGRASEPSCPRGASDELDVPDGWGIDPVIWLAALALLPWVVVAGMVLFGIHGPPVLSPAGNAGRPPAHHLPSVRIVVPARNEARGIEACLRSLVVQDYPDFAITVVDDRSTDGTRRLALSVRPGNARQVEVLAGAPLPAGWFGKPWACTQGSRDAREELFLFTDADTRHEPSLLRSAVCALAEDEASVISLLGRQELGSFGERLVQPQMFTLLALRYRNLARPLEREQRRHAIANGQYILVRRAAYEDIGGHRAVRGEVVEDLRLAQLLTGSGHRLSLRTEQDRLSTRMYQSLGEVLEGWTKNLAIGARQSAGWWGRLALTVIIGYVVLVWLLPPGVFLGLSAAALLGAAVPGVLLAWSAAATLVGLGVWAGVYTRFEVSPAYALLYPLGAAIVGLIALRSGWRGERRVEWKGRRYSRGEAFNESG